MPTNPLDQTSSTGDNTDEIATNPLSGAPNSVAPSAGANVSGASTNASGGGGGGGSQQKPSSTGFTNVNQYVNANADQGAGLGNAIAQNVNQQASQGLQGLSQAQSDFGNQVKAQGANPNQYSTGQVYSTIQNDINANNPNATGVQSDIQQFQNVAKENTNFQAGTDTAPKSLIQVSSYSPADSQLQQAEQAANLTGTESGRATLLQGGTVQSSDPNNPGAQVNITGGFARPNYSTGQVNLDQLLTQNLPQNANTLGNLRNNLLGQYGLANTENQAIQNAATTRQGVVQGTQQAAQNIQDVLYGVPAGTPVDSNGNPIEPGAQAPATQTNAPQNTANMGLNPTQISLLNANGQPAAQTPQQQTQYGILSNLYQQIQNAPAAQNAQQQQNISNTINTLTNYLTQQYGSSIGGVPVATLAQQIVSPQSAAGSANIVNTMTPQQLNQLQTLNQFGGLTGSNINQLGQTGSANMQVIDPTQVGSNQFNAGVTQNFAPAQGAINTAQASQVTAVNAGLNTVATSQTANINGGRWGNLKMSDAQNMLNTWLGPNGIKPGYNGNNWQSAGNVYNDANTIQTAIAAQINQVRTQNGLQPITLEPMPAITDNASAMAARGAAQNNNNTIHDSLQPITAQQSSINGIPNGFQVGPNGQPIVNKGPGPQLRPGSNLQ